MNPIPPGPGAPAHPYRFRFFLLVPLAWVVAAACGDDPFEPQWTAAPDSALIYSLALPDVNLPSAFGFTPGVRSAIVIETPGATGQWDIALDTQGAQLVFLPPGALGINSRARIMALPGVDFADVVEAPRDTTLYVADEPLVVTAGTTYVVQTNLIMGSFSNCLYYAKLEPFAVDVAQGTVEFLYDASPICNDRRLVPPPDDG